MKPIRSIQAYTFEASCVASAEAHAVIADDHLSLPSCQSKPVEQILSQERLTFFVRQHAPLALKVRLQAGIFRLKLCRGCACDTWVQSSAIMLSNVGIGLPSLVELRRVFDIVISIESIMVGQTTEARHRSCSRDRCTCGRHVAFSVLMIDLVSRSGRGASTSQLYNSSLCRLLVVRVVEVLGAASLGNPSPNFSQYAAVARIHIRMAHLARNRSRRNTKSSGPPLSSQRRSRAVPILRFPTSQERHDFVASAIGAAIARRTCRSTHRRRPNPPRNLRVVIRKSPLFFGAALLALASS